MLTINASVTARRLAVGAACIAFCLGAHALVSHQNVALETSDIRVRLNADAAAPMLTSLAGHGASSWQNEQKDALPASVELDGSRVALTWQLKAELTEADKRHVLFVYESAAPHLRLFWRWEARAAFGPLEHRIVVENMSGKELWLPLVDSLRLELQCRAERKLQHFYVEKGADTPSVQGVHLTSVSDGYTWTGTSSTYASPALSNAREIIPAELVFNDDQPHAGWYAGIEFSGRTRISLERSAGSVATVLGLNPDPGPFRTRLEPGEKFETPAVFLGAFSGGPDGAGNQLRPWVRAVLGNPLTWKDPQYPLMVNNSWGSGMQVDEALALRMIEESKELGLEMFHLDAGWFRGVGDWYPNTKKFPHGLAAIADEAHRQGLRFGIWVDWSQAGVDTEPGALNARDPKVKDWLVADLGPNWKPE